FSSLLGPVIGSDSLTGSSIALGAIYDPLSSHYNAAGVPDSRTVFPGNIIPKNRWDAPFAKILSAYPDTNQLIKTGIYPKNDYYFASPGSQTTDQGDGRVDYRISSKDSLFGSLSWSNTAKLSGPPFPGPLDGSGFNGAGETDLSRNAQVSY